MDEAKRVMNGTSGEAWLDSDKVSECYGLQAKVDVIKEDVPICGKPFKSKKVIGYEGKGSMKIRKVNSRMAIKIGEMIKSNREIRLTVISKLADPDAFGAERVALKDVLLDDLTLADWEYAKNGEIEVPFTFEGYEFIDLVTPV